MKSLSNLKCIVMALTVVVVGCAGYAKIKSGVEMGQHYDIIHPQAQVSHSDCTALNQILKKYDKSLYMVQTYKHGSLYKIQTYRRGELVKTTGTLNDNALQEGLASEVAKEAQDTKFTGCAIKAGRTEFPEASPSPSPGGSTTRQTVMAKNDEMVKELRPILEKYNKK